jgi:quercetin dioxygenase-like cupin family protein
MLQYRVHGSRLPARTAAEKEARMAKKAKATPAGKSGKSKLSAGRVYSLAEMVAYAEDSIVSRTLAENKAGTVTLFAFDAGQGLSEHTAPFDALVQVTDGEGTFTVGGKPHRVAAGQVLVMPAGVPHSVKARRRLSMLLTMLRAKGE